jgi:hypothetical protein
MKKSKLLIGALLVCATSLFIWSCGDDFTEEDYLNKQKQLSAEKDSIALSIQVYNGTITSTVGRTEGTKGLTGITVSILSDGRKKTAITDADGLVNFYAQPGRISGTLSGTGFATVNFTGEVDESEDTEGTESGETLTNASYSLPVFETTGARVATIRGNITAELNLLNTTRENVGGVAISFTPDLRFISAAGVTSYRLEGTFVATTDANGAYSIALPTSPAGINYNFAVSDFTEPQRIAINNYENEVAGSVREVVTIPTVFTFSSIINGSLPSNNYTTIPGLNALQIDIEVPPAAFTSAATASAFTLAPNSVNAGNGFDIIAGGSGYPVSSNSIPVTVNPVGSTPSTPAVLYAVSNASGQIINISIVDPDGAGPLLAGTIGAGYTGRATLSIGGGGTGAIVVPRYVSTLNTLTYNGGAGYVVAPNLSVRGLDINGYAVEAQAFTNISNGTVVAFGAPGQPFSSITSVAFVSAERAKASIALADFTVNNLGQISLGNNSGISAGGSGYNSATPPVVTVRSLRAGASGASVIAHMVGNTVNNLVVVDRGTGYSAEQANFPTQTVHFSIVTANGSLNNATPGGGEITIVNQLRPGIIRTLNLYAGTGVRTRGVE